MQEEEEVNERKYSYKSTIKKKYKLTDYQIEQAIKTGLIKDYKYVRNPYYSSKKSLIINIEELEKHLEEIRKLEKYSDEEKERRKEYNERSRKISKISFFCPLCNAKVRPLKDSYTRDAVIHDEIDYENAKIVVIVTHFRHIHTDYDKIRKDNRLLIRHFEGKTELYKLQYFRDYKSDLIEQLKEEKTVEAIELAKKCGLLPSNFAKEDYDKIAIKIKQIYGLT